MGSVPGSSRGVLRASGSSHQLCFAKLKTRWVCPGWTIGPGVGHLISGFAAGAARSGPVQDHKSAVRTSGDLLLHFCQGIGTGMRGKSRLEGKHHALGRCAALTSAEPVPQCPLLGHICVTNPFSCNGIQPKFYGKSSKCFSPTFNYQKDHQVSLCTFQLMEG